MTKEQIIQMLLQTKPGQFFHNPKCPLGSRRMAMMDFDSYDDEQFRVVSFVVEGSPPKIFGTITREPCWGEAAPLKWHYRMRTNYGPFYFDNELKKITKQRFQRSASW